MRNPERINQFLDQFKALWKRYPDMRFGQLVWSILGKLDDVDVLFYAEEDEWQSLMRKFEESHI
jgi:hypothetical protein